MSSAETCLLGLLLGAALGVFFFASLWWSVRRGLASPAPAVWFLLSLLVRSGLVVCAFYVAGRGDWRRLLACLAGFWIARSLVTRLGRAPPAVDAVP
jgi:F1F0 ATPase subunit 2